MQHPPRPGSSACRDGCGRRSPPTRSVEVLDLVRVDSVVERLGGVCESWVLHRLTSRSRVRLALAAGQIVRDARGRYALPGADEAMRRANALSGVLCLDSAARHHGWRAQAPARAGRPSRSPASGRSPGSAGTGSGWCTSTCWTPRSTGWRRTRCARSSTARHGCPFDEALAVADSALRCGDVDAGAAATGRRGLAGPLPGPGQTGRPGGQCTGREPVRVGAARHRARRPGAPRRAAGAVAGSGPTGPGRPPARPGGRGGVLRVPRPAADAAPTTASATTRWHQRAGRCSASPGSTSCSIRATSTGRCARRSAS